MKRVSLVVAGTAILCLAATPAFAQSVVGILNGWQRMMTELSAVMTRNLASGKGFAVDYNSTFNDIEIGTVIAPARYDASISSLNLIGRCTIPAERITVVSGDDLPAGSASGELTLGANASAPPSFLSAALRSVSVGLKLERRRKIAYAFNDISVRQAFEVDFDRVINSPACIEQFNNRPVVFVIRGQVLMKLAMAQGDSMNAGVEGSAGYRRTNTTDDARVGFNVSYNRTGDWKIEQKQARPWFRIVAKLERQADGTYRVAEERAAR